MSLVTSPLKLKNSGRLLVALPSAYGVINRPTDTKSKPKHRFHQTATLPGIPVFHFQKQTGWFHFRPTKPLPRWKFVTFSSVPRISLKVAESRITALHCGQVLDSRGGVSHTLPSYSTMFITFRQADSGSLHRRDS